MSYYGQCGGLEAGAVRRSATAQALGGLALALSYDGHGSSAGKAAVPRAAAISFKPSLFHALAGFIIPLHIFGLRTVGFGLRRVLGLRKYRSCKGDGEGQRHSR